MNRSIAGRHAEQSKSQLKRLAVQQDREDASFALQVTLREAGILREILRDAHTDLERRGLEDTKRGLAIASLFRKLEA